MTYGRWTILLFLSLTAVCIANGVQQESRLVVVLYPESSNGSPGGLLADQSIRATFANSGQHVEIHNEYLDVSRFPDEDYQRDQAALLRRKYAGRNVEVVLAGLASALDYALEYRDEVFPGVPTIFLAVDHHEIRDRKLPADVIGTPARYDLRDTFDLALRLHPRTERVYVIAGKSQFDAGWVAKARTALETHGSRVKVHYLTGLPMGELLRQVAKLPQDSVVFYLHVFEDGEGQVHVPASVLRQLDAVTNSPIYGHVDSYIGHGIVGGRVFSFAEHGRHAATLGLRILNGERADQIGIQPTAENGYQFDWRQLRRWDIEEASLPPGSIVHYRLPGVWEQYKWHITGFTLLVLVQAAFIVHMVAQRRRLAPAERRFRQAVNATPTGMVMVDSNGKMVLANARMEQIFGYRTEEMVGESIEILVPARFRTQHRVLRDGYFSAPDVRSMGAGNEIVGQRKDGSEFPVEIGLNPLPTDTGQFVLASVTDITDRRRSEQDLVQKQVELQELTGKLLEAQETERRRIARDLHDDLGQNLALLSVEMDMLRQKPPASSEQLRSLVEAMADQVKQLSSSVHGLSHQLHPMKLEQLGLPSALKGMCKEVGVSHGVQIDFIAERAPQPIPQEIALCLYRIAQEALHNIVKHSRARHVSLTLDDLPGTIRLQICDDGIGFDLASVIERGGLGLASMRERLRLVDGELAIKSQNSHGTLIEVRVPLCLNES